jgi:hypothetical protein
MDLIPLTDDKDANAHVLNKESTEEFDGDPITDMFTLISILEQDSRKKEMAIDKITECRNFLRELHKKDLKLADHLEVLA